jgi:hypothetical protein
LQLVTLVAGDVRDGAPTHHPERALLGPALVVLFAAADAVGGAFASLPRRRAAAFALCAVAAYGGWVAVRLQRSLRWYEAAPRLREVAAGRALTALPSGTRVLIDTRDFPGGGLDYGYYAVLAAFGRPADAVVDRDQDPRKPRRPSAFSDATTLDARRRETQTRAGLVWGAARLDVALATGAQVLAREGADGWAIVAWP